MPKVARPVFVQWPPPTYQEMMDWVSEGMEMAVLDANKHNAKLQEHMNQDHSEQQPQPLNSDFRGHQRTVKILTGYKNEFFGGKTIDYIKCKFHDCEFIRYIIN